MADQPRIIHVIDPRTDELKRHVTALAAGLRERRVETLVAGPMERRFRDELSLRGVRWATLPLPESLLRREQAPTVAALGRLLASAEPTVVHAHGFYAATPAIAGLPALKSRPVFIYSPHSPVGCPSDRATRVERNARRRLLTESDAVIAATQSEKDALAGTLSRGRGEAIDRVIVVPPGVERRRTSGLFDAGEKRHSVGLRRDAAIVVAAAPLEEGVPFEDFIHVAAAVSRDFPSVEFAIIGDGPRSAALEDMVHREGLFGSTVFLTDRHDAPDIISTCNVFVAICDDANGINYALEALARGIRVVAHDLPGMREVFGATAVVPLADLADQKGFAHAVCAKLEETSDTEDGVRTEDGFVWGIKDVLASDEEYDLDAPGLDPRAQKEEEKTELDLLLDRHSVGNMVRQTIDVYNRALAGR